MSRHPANTQNTGPKLPPSKSWLPFNNQFLLYSSEPQLLFPREECGSALADQNDHLVLLNMSISFFHYPVDSPPSAINTHITHGRKDREEVVCRVSPTRMLAAMTSGSSQTDSTKNTWPGEKAVINESEMAKLLINSMCSHLPHPSHRILLDFLP